MAATDPARPAATLADVARLAGVSAATASRVLTGSSRVRPETRHRVTAAIAQLGYVRQRAPRSAESMRTRSVACVVCEENARVFADPFFARLLWGISQELSAADLQLVLLTLHSPRECQTAARYLRSGHVDGALFVSMHGRLPFDLDSLSIPLVLCGRPVDAGEGLSYVDADNVGGAEQAVHHLLQLGRMAIGAIAGPPDMGPGIDRLLGYRKAMAAAGSQDPGMVAYGDFTGQSGEQAALRLLDHRPRLDAIFAASDLMAVGALRAVHRMGRRVPDDVAVIGFDDSPFAPHTDPPLTTVRQPLGAMAARMARELLATIATPGREPVHLILDTELVRRDSA